MDGFARKKSGDDGSRRLTITKRITGIRHSGMKVGRRQECTHASYDPFTVGADEFRCTGFQRFRAFSRIAHN